MAAEFFTWNASPEIYSIGFLKIRWYSLMFIIGFMGSYYIMRKMYRAAGHDDALVSSLLTWVILGTIIGARLAHCLFYNPSFYFSNPLEFFQVWKGGLASHGGFTGVMLAIFLYCRRYKMHFLWVIDRAAVGGMLIAALIRVGNFFNSEMIGTPSQLPWAIVFARFDTVPRHPAQLYEALTYFVIFLLLSALYRFTSIGQHPGRLWGVALAVAFSARFLLEFFKENQAAFEQNMFINMGQVLSVPFISLGLLLMLRNSNTKNTAS